MESEDLFCEKQLESVFNKIKKNIKKDIHYYAVHQQLDEGVEQITQKLHIQHTINPPHLHENDVYMIAPEESTSDISRLWEKYNNKPKANFTYVIPFSGEFEMFYIQADGHQLDVNSTGIVTKNRLLLIYNAEDFDNAEALQAKFNDDMSVIKENLVCIKKVTDKFNNELNSWISAEIGANKMSKSKPKLKVA